MSGAGFLASSFFLQPKLLCGKYEKTEKCLKNLFMSEYPLKEKDGLVGI